MEVAPRCKLIAQHTVYTKMWDGCMGDGLDTPLTAMTSNAHAVLKIPRGACVYAKKRFCDSVTKLIILKLVLGKIMLGEKTVFSLNFFPPHSNIPLQ